MCVGIVVSLSELLCGSVVGDVVVLLSGILDIMSFGKRCIVFCCVSVFVGVGVLGCPSGKGESLSSVCDLGEFIISDRADRADGDSLYELIDSSVSLVE